MADAPMPTARLGSAGPEISRVGFGAWAIGGGDWAYGWGAQDDRDSIAAIRRALDRGIECGMVWREGEDRTPRPSPLPREIRRECEDSLRGLRTERIDLPQFHWPDTITGTPVEESWGAMADLVGEGR